MDDNNLVDCSEHGRVPSSIVCTHLLKFGLTERVGFVLCDDTPDDLVAWCSACDELARQEGPDAITAKQLRVVCEPCLFKIRDFQNTPD